MNGLNNMDDNMSLLSFLEQIARRMADQKGPVYADPLMLAQSTTNISSTSRRTNDSLARRTRKWISKDPAFRDFTNPKVVLSQLSQYNGAATTAFLRNQAIGLGYDIRLDGIDLTIEVNTPQLRQLVEDHVGLKLATTEELMDYVRSRITTAFEMVDRLLINSVPSIEFKAVKVVTT